MIGLAKKSKKVTVKTVFESVAQYNAGTELHEVADKLKTYLPELIQNPKLFDSLALDLANDLESDTFDFTLTATRGSETGGVRFHLESITTPSGKTHPQVSVDSSCTLIPNKTFNLARKRDIQGLVSKLTHRLDVKLPTPMMA